MKSKYLLKKHKFVLERDLPQLPDQLKQTFEDICQAVLSIDPHRCLGLPSHALKGNLAGCRAVDLNWNGVAYRLVYRIYESPAPKRVFVLSIAEHDPAYERATARK